MVPFPCMSNGKDKEFEYTFLKIYRYLKSLQYLYFIPSMRKIYVILVELCMKWTLLSGLKGSNYYKNVEKVHNFRIKSVTGKTSIPT